jgi:hypothetical protein
MARARTARARRRCRLATTEVDDLATLLDEVRAPLIQSNKTGDEVIERLQAEATERQTALAELVEAGDRLGRFDNEMRERTKRRMTVGEADSLMAESFRLHDALRDAIAKAKAL